AGGAVLEVMVEHRLAERAARIGAIMMDRLAQLDSSAITAIRGLGLLLGIEFTDAAAARRFVAETIARGVVVNGTLNADRVVRLAPPLTIEDEEIDFAISAMME